MKNLAISVAIALLLTSCGGGTGVTPPTDSSKNDRTNEENTVKTVPDTANTTDQTMNHPIDSLKHDSLR